MNRRPRALPLRAAFLCALFTALTVALSSATPALRILPTSLATLVPGGGHLGVAPTRYYRAPRWNPLAGRFMRLPVPALPGQRPLIDLTRTVPTTDFSTQQVGVIGSTSDIPRQAVNQSTFPRPPQIGVSTPSQDIQPTWSPDEAWIYFASNRSNVNGTAAGANFHIWRMTSDGNRVEQVTGVTTEELSRDQLYPAVAQNGLIAFSERAGPNAAAQIIVLDVRDIRQRLRTIVTGPGADPRYAVGDAVAPTWSPGSESLALAANKAGVYNIYTINLRLGDIRQLTNGTQANGIDSRDPAWSPGGTLIAFDSNAAGVDVATGLLAGTAPKRNIFVSYLTGPNTAGPNGKNTQPFVQLTKFPNADSIEPSYSQQTGDTANKRLLVFASQRADTDDDGKADTALDTYNIYWVQADSGKALPNTSDVKPEDPTGNPAQPVITEDTDLNLPVAQRNKSNQRHPSFPPFIRSTRVAYQSDSAGNNDIWTAAFADVTAPSLEALNQGSGEILRVARLADASPSPAAIGRREFVAGDQVVIMARAQDLQSGILRQTVDGKDIPVIYAQIRDPDGKYQDAQGKEHKTYFREDDAPQNPIDPIAIHNDFVIRMPVEQSSEVIDPHDPTGKTYSHPWYPNVQVLQKEVPVCDPDNPNADPPKTEVIKVFKVLEPTYIPAKDDVQAWSGKPHAPRGDWLALYDDGPAPGGHEPVGQAAGDNVFSNVWQTPPIPSDYILDVITYDRAIDPLARGPGENWKIWDNVWGFTTQPFVSQNPVLAVMDYPEGQRFLAGTGSGRTASGGFRPVESFLLDMDEKLFPKTLEPKDPEACPPEMVDKLISSNRQSAVENTLGAVSFRGNTYDLWRVICRGPVDRSVLLSYASTQVDQVDPAAFDQAPNPNGTYPTVRVPVAEKAVYWASPYTGDLWVGRGTLTDASMQALLTEFVQEKSGRLFITGQDIGWALTLNGSLDNAFFRDILKAKFEADSGTVQQAWQLTAITEGDVGNDWPNRDIASPIDSGNQNGGRRIEEIPPDPYQDATQTRAPDNLLISVVGEGTDFTRTDGSLNQGFPDKVSPLQGATRAYAYADNLFDGALYNIDPKTNGRVVYLSFGLESLFREYDSGTNAQIVLNFRAKLLHNALCWMTTGQIRGRVVDVQGLRPVSGAVVRATPQDLNNKQGAVTRTAVTDANGNFVIRGIVPQPGYDITASVPGFTSQHLGGVGIHGMEAANTSDLTVSRAAPGSISGVVKNAAGSPIPGAVVVAKLTAAEGYLGQVDFAASTSASGQFRFGDLPIGTYTLRIDPDYLKSSGYTGSTPANLTAGVSAAKDTPGINFTLGGGTTPTPGPGPGTPTEPQPGTGLKTFQPGLYLLSAPYDYPNDDAASLLNLQPADLEQKLAAYANDAAGFRYYAAPEAKSIRLGRGYFVRFMKPAVITKQGTLAPTNQPFMIALNSGWNLIGDPFPASIRWGDVQVQVSGQNTPLTVAQAIQGGALRPGLLTLGGNPYRDSSTLEPWNGYWVRAARPVTLLIPPPSATAAARRPERLPGWDSKSVPPSP